MLKKIILYISLTGILIANVDIPNNRCALIVASSKHLYEIKNYIDNKINDKRYLNVYQSNNGRYAISIGFLKDYEVDRVMNRWKSSGKIPRDSFCAKSYKFIREVRISEYNNNNYNTYSSHTNKPNNRNYETQNKVSEENSPILDIITTFTPWGRGLKALKLLKKR